MDVGKLIFFQLGKHTLLSNSKMAGENPVIELFNALNVVDTDKLEKEVTELDMKVKQLKTNKRRFQNELEDAEDEGDEAKVQELEEKVSRCRRAFMRQTKTLKAKKEELESATGPVSERVVVNAVVLRYMEAIKSTSEELQKKRKEIAELQVKLSLLKEEEEKLKTDIEDGKEASRAVAKTMTFDTVPSSIEELTNHLDKVVRQFIGNEGEEEEEENPMELIETDIVNPVSPDFSLSAPMDIQVPSPPLESGPSAPRPLSLKDVRFSHRK